MTRIDTGKIEWLHRPNNLLIQRDRIIVETQEYSSLIGKDRAHEPLEGKWLCQDTFRFTLRVDFFFCGQFDQCGISLYIGDQRLMQFGIKRKDKSHDELECVVFRNRFGDRNVRLIGTAIQRLYLRVWKRGHEVRAQYSFHGQEFLDFRQFHLDDLKALSLGLYAASPLHSSFNCIFSHMDMSEEEE